MSSYTSDSDLPTAESYRRYHRRFLLGVGSLVAFLTVVNVSVDPFTIFERFHGDMFDTVRAHSRPRIRNSVLAAQGDYDVALIGSSRVIYAFEMGHSDFGGRRAVNLGVPRTSIVELEQIFRSVCQTSPTAEVFLCLDFHAFEREREVPAAFDRSRFSPHYNPVDFYVDKMISHNTSRRSVNVLRRWWKDEDPDVIGEIAVEEIARGFRGVDSVFGGFSIGPEQRAALERIIVEARTHPGGTQILLLPLHATYLEGLRVSGVWAEVESWKRLVVSAAAESIPVWDFMTYSKHATVPLVSEIDPPPAAEWFHDPSHISRAFGSLIRDRVIGKSEEAGGGRVTRANLDEQLAADRRARDEYAERCPDEVRWVRTQMGRTAEDSAHSAGNR